MKKDLGRRIDLHMHSELSDGVIPPTEIALRAAKAGYEAMAVTDHVNPTNIQPILEHLLKYVEVFNDSLPIKLIPGVELTYVKPDEIDEIASKARQMGAKIVVVHGETLVEPVYPGTNHAAVQCNLVDILAHNSCFIIIRFSLTNSFNLIIYLLRLLIIFFL